MWGGRPPGLLQREDIVYAPGIDVHAAHLDVKHSIEATGGKLPAEHGHGTEYKAPQDTQERWRRMDPLNVMNPGVGKTSSFRGYSDRPAHLDGWRPRARNSAPKLNSESPLGCACGVGI